MDSNIIDFGKKKIHDIQKGRILTLIMIFIH